MCGGRRRRRVGLESARAHQRRSGHTLWAHRPHFAQCFASLENQLPLDVSFGGPLAPAGGALAGGSLGAAAGASGTSCAHRPAYASGGSKVTRARRGAIHGSPRAPARRTQLRMHAPAPHHVVRLVLRGPVRGTLCHFTFRHQEGGQEGGSGRFVASVAAQTTGDPRDAI